MANKKKTALPSPIQQLIAYAAPKDDKCILSLPISETENIDIEVKRLLSVDDMVSFVDGVTNALFVNNTYYPALYELVLAKAILAYYTDLKIEIPNVDVISLVFDTDIVGKVGEKIHKGQFENMVNAIKKSIEFKKQEIINTQATRLDEAISQIELLTDATSKMTEQFDGIDMKQATEAAIKIANIPERELVDNILDIKFRENMASDVDEAENDGDENV